MVNTPVTPANTETQLSTNVSSGSESVRSVTRALTILTAINVQELTLSEIAAVVDVPLPTAFRMVRTLESSNFVSKTSGGSYVLGPEMVRLGYLADAQGHDRWNIRTAVRGLRDDTDESVGFWVKSGVERVCTELAESSKQVRWISRIGQTSTVYRGAVGTVLLAFDTNHSDEFAPEEATTQSVIKQLSAARKDGYAISSRQTSQDLWAVAAPVYAGDTLKGALVIGVPISRVSTSREVELIEACRGAAAALSQPGPFLASYAISKTSEE